MSWGVCRVRRNSTTVLITTRIANSILLRRIAVSMMENAMMPTAQYQSGLCVCSTRSYACHDIFWEDTLEKFLFLIHLISKAEKMEASESESAEKKIIAHSAAEIRHQVHHSLRIKACTAVR